MPIKKTFSNGEARISNSLNEIILTMFSDRLPFGLSITMSLEDAETFANEMLRRVRILKPKEA